MEEEKLKFPQAPEKNSSFRKEKTIQIKTNYLKMHFNPNKKHAMQFSIKIEPTIAEDNTILLRSIIKKASNELKENFSKYFHSGFSLFVNDSKNSKLTLEVEFNEIKYNVIIEKTKNLIELNNIRSEGESNQVTKMFMETLIKQIIMSNDGMIKFKKGDFYNYSNKVYLNNNNSKEQIIFGFSTGTVITSQGLYLRISNKNKYISGQSAIEKIKDLAKKTERANYKNIIKEYFQNKTVLTMYGNYRTIIIDDITFDSNPNNTTINIKDEEKNIKTITLVNYYKMQYGIDIKDKSQCLFIVHKKNSEEVNFIIPELVYLTGMDDDIIEKGGRHLKQNMIKLTKKNPNENFEKYSELLKLLTNDNPRKKKKNQKNIPLTPKQIKDSWGLEFDNFETIEGRILDPPTLNYNKYNEQLKKEKTNFTHKPFIRATTFKKDEWIIITTKDDKNYINKIINSLIKASKNIQVLIEEPKIESFNIRNGKQLIEEMKNLNLKKYKLLFFILGKYTKNYYTNIKQYCIQKLGIPSQVFSTENIDKKNLSVYSNVIAQMVVKTGGELYEINNIVPNDKVTMAIGINCKKIKDNEFLYCLTSTYNKQLSKFLTVQIKSSDKRYALSVLLRKALENFRTKGAPRYPDFIFIYREGGNEGDKIKILNTEIPIIKEILNVKNNNNNNNNNNDNNNIENNNNNEIDINDLCFDKNYSPKFFYMCVNKKTISKFFEMYDNKNLNNPTSGMTIDSGVTSSDRYEFFIQPQKVNQGTASPVEFTCLFDNTNLPIETVEKLTYNFTYYYWNWSGPVRLPSILKFTETYLNFYNKYLPSDPIINDNLINKPYYI